MPSPDARQLLDDLLARQRAGEEVELEAVASAYPDRADELRVLWLEHVREEESRRSRAERIYAGAEVDRGAPDVEALCRAHPDLEPELRAIEEDRAGFPDLAAALPGRSPGVTEPEATPDPAAVASELSDFPAQVVERLSGRRVSFERYRLLEEIGRGGQGAVLRVWDEDLKRSLAMKLVVAEDEAGVTVEGSEVDSRTLGRFLEEAQVTGQLEHPGIVPVHELGLDSEGRIYFTMKLVKGETLRAIFEKVHGGVDDWTVTRALGVLLRVCEAVTYAHAKRVIHRDLKPANVMVGRFGEVYVMDWGLARILGTEDRKDIRIRPRAQASQTRIHSDRRAQADFGSDSPLITMDGDVVGTPAYMSPEQAHGALEEVGPRSDVYSIGAMLYHLLVGRAPYIPASGRVHNYAVWQRVQEGPPPSVTELARNAPPQLAAICERAMARDPEARYPSAEDLAADLSAYLENRVVAAYAKGPLAELRQWTRRNPKAFLGIVASILLFVAGVVVVERFQRSAAAARREADANEEARALTSLPRWPWLTEEERASARAAVDRVAARILAGRASERDCVLFGQNVINARILGRSLEEERSPTAFVEFRSTGAEVEGLGLWLQPAVRLQADRPELPADEGVIGLSSDSLVLGLGLDYRSEQRGKHVLRGEVAARFVRSAGARAGATPDDVEFLSEPFRLSLADHEFVVLERLPESYPPAYEDADRAAALADGTRVDPFAVERRGDRWTGTLSLHFPRVARPLPLEITLQVPEPFAWEETVRVLLRPGNPRVFDSGAARISTGYSLDGTSSISCRFRPPAGFVEALAASPAGTSGRVLFRSSREVALQELRIDEYLEVGFSKDIVVRTE